MIIKLRLYFTVIGFILFTACCYAHSQSNQTENYSPSMTDKYSQKTLLKNWALCACLADIAKDPRDRADANESASGYFEFGDQPIEAYDALSQLAQQYANRKYQGSIKSEFNTMKCIDLFHSKELDDLAEKLSKSK